MPDYLGGFFLAALGVVAWFIAPVIARSHVEIWFPSLGEVGFKRVATAYRMGAAALVLVGLLSVAAGAFLGR